MEHLLDYIRLSASKLINILPSLKVTSGTASASVVISWGYDHGELPLIGVRSPDLLQLVFSSARPVVVEGANDNISLVSEQDDNSSVSAPWVVHYVPICSSGDNLPTEIATTSMFPTELRDDHTQEYNTENGVIAVVQYSVPKEVEVSVEFSAIKKCVNHFVRMMNSVFVGNFSDKKSMLASSKLKSGMGAGKSKDYGTPTAVPSKQLFHECQQSLFNYVLGMSMASINTIFGDNYGLKEKNYNLVDDMFELNLLRDVRFAMLVGNILTSSSVGVESGCLLVKSSSSSSFLDSSERKKAQVQLSDSDKAAIEWCGLSNENKNG